jgi:5-methylcytosine-specific restriction endonuclease McrA
VIITIIFKEYPMRKNKANRLKFLCPGCHEKVGTKVTDTDISYNGVIRRRLCENCGTVIFTKEVVDHIKVRRPD